MPSMHARRPGMPNRRNPRSSTVSRQQLRTETTRRKLLGAAERIFARSGFEAARLEDIAALAGYTRGAFYANFEGKEDIFFALLEDWVGRRIATVEAVLERDLSAAERLRELREYYAQLATDRRFVLLSFEFRLFAIRHPRAHARLRAWQRRLRATVGNILRRVMKESGRALPLSGIAVATGFGALSNALLLEHLVDQHSVSEEEIRHLLGVFFDAVLGNRTAP